MSTPLLKLGFRVPRADAFSLNQAALSPLVPMSPSTAEQEAAAHWLFGSDQDTGSPVTWPDLISKQLLTLTGSATVNSNSVSLGVGSNFLTSPVADAAVQTVCAVVQQQALPGSGIGAGIFGGIGGSNSDGAVLSLTFPIGNSAGYWAWTPPSAIQSLPLPGATGNYIFLAMSHAPQIGPTPPTRTVFSSGSHITTIAVTKTPLGANLQFGGTQDSASGALVACELIIFNKYLTAVQMAAVYARSQSRLTARGITVV